MKRSVFVGLVVLLAVTAAGGAVFFMFVQTYHFAVVQENVLYRDGLQGMRRFRNAYRFHPFKTVINIQSDADVQEKYLSQCTEEQQFCAEHGVKWFHIPMKQSTPPTVEQVEEFLKIASEKANQPVFVHDSQGVIREGMMVAVWQMERMGFDRERAIREINLFGHPMPPELIDFIKTYKKVSDAPATAAVSPASK